MPASGNVSRVEHDRLQHHSHVGRYLVVWGALLVLTIATYLIAKIHIAGALAIVVALVIATAKGALVALFFMHLWDQRGRTGSCSSPRSSSSRCSSASPWPTTRHASRSRTRRAARCSARARLRPAAVGADALSDVAAVAARRLAGARARHTGLGRGLGLGARFPHLAPSCSDRSRIQHAHVHVAVARREAAEGRALRERGLAQRGRHLRDRDARRPLERKPVAPVEMAGRRSRRACSAASRIASR